VGIGIGGRVVLWAWTWWVRKKERMMRVETRSIEINMVRLFGLATRQRSNGGSADRNQKFSSQIKQRERG
jgi:hypothetical protein